LKYLSPRARLAIYAEDQFGKITAKTAEGVIRYGVNPIACVIDSQSAGKSIAQMVGIDCPAPIVNSLQDSLAYKPDALLLGTTPSGGELPRAWRKDIITALQNGMDVVNGLHDFLNEDEEIAQIARKCGQTILDVRKPPEHLPIASGKAIDVRAMKILTVGSDSSIGKMTTTLELTREVQKRGLKAKFVATGQTGIMINGGQGVAIDRVIGDFMAGATEQMVVEAGQDNDFVFVEGQGSLAHAGYSGVSLSLLHGTCPDAMVLCHEPTRKVIARNVRFPMLKLETVIQIHETMAALIQPAKIIGIALNTRTLDDEMAKQTISKTAQETGLPCTDAVRYGAGILVDAILAFQNSANKEICAKSI
jgi:uncharacterized NAD-dependent epimerase/dehydratase family protein